MERTCKTLLPVIASALTLLIATPLSAQVSLQKIRANRISASGIHTPYPEPRIQDTPPPEGYAPFYISHVARHGSRYNTNAKELEGMIATMHRLDSAGILTRKGKDLMRQLDTMYAISSGRFGALSARGAREHRGIARRMHSRFPSVFEERKDISGASSNSIRCIMSMTAFSLGLESKDTTLQFDLRSDENTKKYLLKNHGISKATEVRKALVDPVRKREFNPDRFFSVLVNDKAAMKSIVKDPRHFCKDLYVAGGIAHCIDMEKELDLYAYFTDQELLTLARIDTYDFYGDHGNSKESGRERVALADELVRDIISRADEAITPSSPRAADIRFTHDWMVSPLFAFIGVEELNFCVSLLSADKYWMTSDSIPMAANVQFIFYRGGQQGILVKVLLNEKETRIPAIEPVSGPYYRWEDLRAHLENRLAWFSPEA